MSKIGLSDKKNATLLFTVNAAGKIITKSIILSYKRMPECIVNEIPDGWSLGKTQSGWMKNEAFYEYTANHFRQKFIK